jgi:cytosine/adenosine deaminase-related metal-dependent hydrolase
VRELPRQLTADELAGLFSGRTPLVERLATHENPLSVARGRGGPGAMTAREALRLGTRGGAEVLRRSDIGSLEPGKRADFAVWRTDGLEFGGAEDLVANLVFSGPHRVDRLLVGGVDVVRGGSLVRADEQEIAREHRKQAGRLWQ